jgi:hypothetical protein
MTPAEQQQWIDENCFTCGALNAKITQAQCDHNRTLPRIMDGSIEKRFGSLQRRPLACDECPRYGLKKKEYIPAPVIRVGRKKIVIPHEDIKAALEYAKTIKGAARILNVSQRTLGVMIHGDKDLSAFYGGVYQR